MRRAGATTSERAEARRTAEVASEQRLSDGAAIELTRERLVAPLDEALSVLCLRTTAAGLVACRLPG
jgi:phosphotransferase system IIA component